MRHAQRNGRQVGRLVLRWVLLGSMVAVLSSADIAAGAGQELPAGGGQIPPLRRGANGQIEVVPPATAAPTRPKASSTRTITAPKLDASTVAPPAPVADTVGTRYNLSADEMPSVARAIMRRANAATAPPKPPANSITIINTSGVVISSYPFQFGRPFLQRAIPHAPQVLINGRPVTTQADVKNRYPDGSVEFAVIAVVVPSLPNNTPVTLSFADTTRKDDKPLTQAQMLDPSYNFDAVMTLTPASGAAQTASGRRMLSDGNCKPWTSGQIAQTMMCADDSAARKYDIGFGDGYHPFRPRFYATFWPARHQVYVRAVGENGLSTEIEDLSYKLAISSNGTTLYTKDLSGATLTATNHPLIHWAGGRWTKEFWLGGAPTQQVNIDNNLPYLTSTRFLPNLDPTVVTPAATIASYYTRYIATPADNDIYNTGAWPFSLATAMGVAGDSSHIGVFPVFTMLWLHNPDWRMRYMALRQTDLAAAWPLDYRESDPTRRFQRTDAVGSGTGLGRVISAAGRPASFGSTDDMKVVGPQTAGGNLTWSADTQHQPSVYFPAYVLTGDPWYLDMLYSWAACSVFIDAYPPPYVCTTQVTYCSNYRGPTGAYGGFYGFDAARDIAWTLRGRVETAFIAPDGTPEKSYFTYMTNDAIAKWDAGLGFTGTPFDTSTEYVWVKGTDYPYVWTNNGGSAAGQVPPLGGMASICDPATLCSYSPAIQTSWGLLAGADGTFDDPWMNFYLEYAVGRAVELGFPMQQIQAQLEKLPIGIIGSTAPQLLGAYTYGVEKLGGGFWPTWAAYIAGGADPTYTAALETGWVGGMSGGRQTWVQPGLAMAVDDAVLGAVSAWSWYNANGYSLPEATTYRNTDSRWAVIPRTDSNVLPAQSTLTPP